MPQLCPPAVTARPAAAHTHTLGQPPPAHPPTSDTNPAPKLSPRAVPGALSHARHHPITPSHTPGGYTHPGLGVPALQDVAKGGKRPLPRLAAAELLHQCLLSLQK